MLFAEKYTYTVQVLFKTSGIQSNESGTETNGNDGN